MSSLRHFIGLWVIGFAMSAACGAPAVDPHPTAEALPDKTDAVAAMLILDPLRYNEAYDAYTAAYFEFVDRCMRTAGYVVADAAPPKLPTPLVDDRPIRERRGFGFLPPVGQFEGFPVAVPMTPYEEMVATMSEAEQAAYGRQFDQCSTAASAETDELRPASDAGTQGAIEAAREWATAQPEHVAALTDWQDCMQNAGYDFPTSTAVVESVISDEVSNQYRNQWSQAVYEFSLEELALPPQLTDVFSRGELDDLTQRQDAEIRLALADWDCGAGADAILRELLNRYLSDAAR